MGARKSQRVDKPGPEAVGAIIKRYRKRDRQFTYGLRIRAYGERFWVPLGTEREGWNDVRARHCKVGAIADIVEPSAFLTRGPQPSLTKKAARSTWDATATEWSKRE